MRGLPYDDTTPDKKLPARQDPIAPLDEPIETNKYCIDRRSGDRKVHRHRRFIAGLLAFILLVSVFHVHRRVTHGAYYDYDMIRAESMTFTFDSPSDLSILEKIDAIDGDLDVHGDVHILTDLPKQDSAFRVDVRMTADNGVSIAEPLFDQTTTSLTIGTPRLRWSNRSMRRPRLRLEVTVHAAHHASLHDLSINTPNLNIHIAPTLSLAVLRTTTLTTAHGNICVADWLEHAPSRNIHLRTTSGSISGRYYLYDVLSAISVSGSINLSVAPRAADSDEPQPAHLRASSESGSIDIEMTPWGTGWADREYRADVGSRSGSVAGAFVHGSHSHFSSMSGSIKVGLLPFDAAVDSRLETHSVNGRTEVTMKSPLKDSKRGVAAAALDKLTSTHKSASGSIDLRYPGEWTGTFDGTSVSGSLDAEGKDVVVRRKGKLPGQVYIEGVKGDGKSLMDFKTVSGSVGLRVG